MIDIDYRYRRALQPDGLTTFETCLSAINDAVADARLAGIDPAKCPAIALLRRHMASMCDKIPVDQDDQHRKLRASCMERIADLKNKPAIIALVLRGLDHRPEELRHYRREGYRALRQIAAHLQMPSAQCRIEYNSPNSTLAGDHTLEVGDLFVRISPERYGEPGLAWRNRHWKKPGNVMRKAPITELRDIPKLANKIRRDLDLKLPPQSRLI